MMIDPEDVDRQREGILLLSSKPWGIKDPYVKGYATIFKTSENDGVRGAAIVALGRAGDPMYLKEISDAMGDPSAKVRWAAADVLGLLPFAKANDAHLPAAAARLRDHAKADQSPDVRAACAKALRNHTGDSVVEALVDCLEDKEFGVRWQAHESLCAISGLDLGYEQDDWSEYLVKRGARPAARPANSAPRRLADLLGPGAGEATTNPSAPASAGTDGGAR
jgi:hypothetical protein